MWKKGRLVHPWRIKRIDLAALAKYLPVPLAGGNDILAIYLFSYVRVKNNLNSLDNLLRIFVQKFGSGCIEMSKKKYQIKLLQK